jgi:hypothetical protein
MQHPEAATFDILAGYYGPRANFSCPHCVRWARAAGKPFRIVHTLAHSEFWERLVAEGGYEYVWLADDDLVIDTCSLNTFFAIMKQVRAGFYEAGIPFCHYEAGGNWHLLPRRLFRYREAGAGWLGPV